MILTSVYGNGRPTEPTFFEPMGGFTETRQVTSVNPYPSIISTPAAPSKRLNNSIGIGADPEKACLMLEISASTGLCINCDTAVGTVIIKVIFQRSINFQKLSKTPSPR